MLAGAQIVDNGSVAFSQTPAPQEVPKTVAVAIPSAAPESVATQGLSRVPTIAPVDISFSNITCTVKLGINKGIVHFQRDIFLARSVLNNA